MTSKIIDVIKLLSAATGQRKSCGGAMSARTLSLFTSKAAKMLLVGCLLTCGIFFSAVAQTVTQGGLTYTLNTDGYTASVSGYNAATLTAQCTIPATVTYNDAVYTVTAIGNAAFYNCTGLTSVTFADGSQLDTIGEYAFYGCSSLSTIAFPASLKVIKKDAFSYSGLTSITLGAELDSVGNLAFYGCNALTTVQWNSPNLKYTDNGGWYLFANNTSIQSVTFGNTVEIVPDYAFQNCTGLATVSFADGSQLDTIGEYAFYGCSSLSTIAFPASLKVIKKRAFYNSGLTSITLGAELDSVGNFAFYGCNALTTVQWNSPNLKYTNNDGWYLFANNTSIQSVTFGNTVEIVPDYAFQNCTGLSTVSFAEGSQLDTIGEYAFEGCSSLSTIAFPASLKVIKKYAFYNCSGLTSITLGAELDSVGNFAFYGCNALTTVQWNSPNLKYTDNGGWYLFANNTSIQSVTFGNTVEIVPDYAFQNCTGLSTVSFAEGSQLDTIGEYAFEGCSSLSTIAFPASLKVIKKYAFYNCSGLTSITLGAELDSVGNFAFYGCNALTTVQWNSPNLKYTNNGGQYLFANNTSIQSVTFGSTVEVVPYGAFRNCTGLTTVSFADGSQLDTIGEIAFEGCSSLSTIALPASLKVIKEYAFYGCSNLTSITSNAQVPPTMGTDVWAEVPTTAVVTVPCGTLSVYRNDTDWGNEFSDIREDVPYSITVTSTNEAMGTATMDDILCSGIELTATANCGYRFTQWSNGVTENPYTVVLTKDTALTAIFEAYTISGTDVITACDSYTWIDGVTYTSSNNTAQYTLTNAAGCDSVVTLNLTINHSVYDTIVDTAINEYTWNGEIYTQSGVYEYVAQTATGCDSIVVLILTIQNIGVEVPDMLDNLKFYPNPAQSIITFNTEDIVKVEVLDGIGRMVAVFENSYRIDISQLAKGYYTMRITTSKGITIRRVVKQ